MPEYLAPGVFVEEVSFRAKSIEGVSTSTTGFVGLTSYGPVRCPDGPSADAPRAIGSFAEFERVFGGLGSFDHGADAYPYTAHAARAFFANGGQRLYVARVFNPKNKGENPEDWGVASADVSIVAPVSHWKARWPGAAGNVIVDCQVQRSDNVAYVYPVVPGSPVNRNDWGYQVRGAGTGTIVEVVAPDPKIIRREQPLVANSLFVLVADPVSGQQTFIPHTPHAGGPLGAIDTPNGGCKFPAGASVEMRVVEVNVSVQSGERIDPNPRLATHAAQPRFIGKVMEKDTPVNEDGLVWLHHPLTDADHGPLRHGPTSR